MSSPRPPGCVAAGDRRTAAAGAEILRAGGNAVDAAVAATCAAWVCEPILTGPFGGGFALVADAQAPAMAYDLFADVPGRGLGAVGQGLDFAGLEVSFGPATQSFHVGRGATAVPRLLPGLLTLQAERGRLPLAPLLAPALALARAGAGLSPEVAPIAAILTPILNYTQATAALYAPGGMPLGTTNPFVSLGLLRLLEALQAGTPAAELQACLLPAFGPPHGRLTAADLTAAGLRRRAPLQVQVGPFTVLLTPPPSLGGLLVGLGLELLETVPATTWADERLASLQLLGCMAATQSIRAATVDPAARAGSTALDALEATLRAPELLAAGRAEQAHVARYGVAGGPAPGRHLGSTTHISVLDGDGGACAITSSNGEGCGHLVPGCGVMANNFLGEADINPAGFHRRPAGEAMLSMMCPTLVLHQGRPILALGTGGSNRIRTALLQVLVQHLLRGQTVADAVQAPRLHYEGGPLYVERAVLTSCMPAATLAALTERCPQLVPFDAANMFFGGVHVAGTGTDAPGGAGDGRRGGAVVIA